MTGKDFGVESDRPAVHRVFDVAGVESNVVSTEDRSAALTDGDLVVPDEPLPEKGCLPDKIGVAGLVQQIHRKLAKSLSDLDLTQRRRSDHSIESVSVGRQPTVPVFHRKFAHLECNQRDQIGSCPVGVGRSLHQYPHDRVQFGIVHGCKCQQVIAGLATQCQLDRGNSRHDLTFVWVLRQVDPEIV